MCLLKGGKPWARQGIQYCSDLFNTFSPFCIPGWCLLPCWGASHPACSQELLTLWNKKLQRWQMSKRKEGIIMRQNELIVKGAKTPPWLITTTAHSSFIGAKIITGLILNAEGFSVERTSFHQKWCDKMISYWKQIGMHRSPVIWDFAALGISVGQPSDLH